MTETPLPRRMPPRQVQALRRAFSEFNAARDPSDPWAGRRLASVINAATSAGWSRRTVAAELGISRERTLKLSQYRPSLRCTVERYRRGTSFPEPAVAAFRRIEAEITERRREAEAKMASLIRSAHEAGWPYHLIGQEVGATGEWIRRISEMHPGAGTSGETFDPYTRVPKPRPEPKPRGRLTEEERDRMRRLAVLARANTKAARTKAEREASEQLSALIIAAKERRITWDDLDEACGYRPGSARARAVRHGYGKLPPSMKAYSPAKKQFNV